MGEGHLSQFLAVDGIEIQVQKLLLEICVFAVEGRREEKGTACVRRLEELCVNERNLIQDGTENSSFCSAKDT